MSKNPQYNPRSIILVRAVDIDATPVPDPGDPGAPKMPAADVEGILLTRVIGIDDLGDYQAMQFVELNIDDVSDNLQAIVSGAFNYGFNDDNNSWDRFRTANPVDIDAAPRVGVQLTTGPGQWSEVDAPAADTQASVTHAAVAGQRHVVTGATFTIAGLASSVGGITCRIRDGAGGTILWESGIYHSTGQNSITIDVRNLALACSTNTAAVAEFSAAPGDATLYETITLNGYTV